MALKIIQYNIDKVMNKNTCSNSNKNIPASLTRKASSYLKLKVLSNKF